VRFYFPAECRFTEGIGTHRPPRDSIPDSVLNFVRIVVCFVFLRTTGSNTQPSPGIIEDFSGRSSNTDHFRLYLSFRTFRNKKNRERERERERERGREREGRGTERKGPRLFRAAAPLHPTALAPVCTNTDTREGYARMNRIGKNIPGRGIRRAAASASARIIRKTPPIMIIRTLHRDPDVCPRHVRGDRFPGRDP